MANEKMTKLRTRTKPGESFWAEDLGNGMFRIANVLAFTRNYTLDDIVRATSGGYVNKVVERKRQTVGFNFEGVPLEKAHKFLDWLKPQISEADAKWEGMVWPFMCAAIPVTSNASVFGFQVDGLHEQWVADEAAA